MWKINQLNIDLYLQCKRYWLAVDVAELVVEDVAANCVVVVADGVVVVVCCFVVDGWVVDDGSIVVGCFVVADSIVLVVNAGVVVICCNVIDEVVCCFVVDDNLIVGNDCTVVDVDGDVVVVECIFFAVVVELMIVVSEVVDVWGDNDISPEDVDFVVDIVIGRSQIFGSIWRMSWTVPENSSRAAILWSFVQFTPKSTRIFSNTQSTADKIYLKKRKKNLFIVEF